MQLKTILNRVQKVQIVCVWCGAMGGDGQCTGFGSGYPSPRRQSWFVFGVWSPAGRLRSLVATPLRVRAAVGHQGLPGVCAQARGLSSLWGQGGAAALGIGQMSADGSLCLVSGGLGETAVLERRAAAVFHTTWDTVFNAVEMAVAWGLAHRDLSAVESIGIDEIAWQRGHRYLTLVYQIDSHCKRLLWIGEKRTVKTLLHFFRWFGPERSLSLRFVCSDMWKPYLKVIARKAGQATHVLDRFHIMAHMGKAIDEVRAQEVRELKAHGEEPVLTKTRWLLAQAPGAAEREADQPSVGAVAAQPEDRAQLPAQGRVPAVLGLSVTRLGPLFSR